MDSKRVVAIAAEVAEIVKEHTNDRGEATEILNKAKQVFEFAVLSPSFIQLLQNLPE